MVFMMLCVSIQAPFHVVHWRTAIFTVCFVKETFDIISVFLVFKLHFFITESLL